MYKVFFELTPSTDPFIVEELHELTTTAIHGKTGFESMTGVHVQCQQEILPPCVALLDTPSYVTMDITWDTALYELAQVRKAMTWLFNHIIKIYDQPYIVMFYVNEKT